MSGSEAEIVPGDRGDKGITKLPRYAKRVFDAAITGEFYCEIVACGRHTRFLYWDRANRRTTCHNHDKPRPPLTATYGDVLRRYEASKE